MLLLLKIYYVLLISIGYLGLGLVLVGLWVLGMLGLDVLFKFEFEFELKPNSFAYKLKCFMSNCMVYKYLTI